MGVSTNRDILITGGAGFIGYHLARKLHRSGLKVVILDNLSASGSSYRAKKLRKAGIEVIIGDVRHRRKLFQQANGFKTIFHLAAMSSVPDSYRNPQLDCKINVEGTVNLLEVARRSDAKLVFTSSSTVYGMPKIVPTSETHPLYPISFYGLSKLVAEQYCQLYHKSYGLFVVSLRLFNVYGPEATSGVIIDFLHKLRTDNCQLKVIGSGEQSKDFVYIDDTVEALVRCAVNKHVSGEVFNVGSGETVNIVKLAKHILEILNLSGKTKIVCGQIENWPGDVIFTQADISKIKEHLKWIPKTKLEDGLKQTIEWFKLNYGPIVQQ